MNNYSLFIRWLVVAGVVDWLLARSITRVAIFIPMPPTFASAFRLLDTVGQVAGSLLGLLGLIVLGMIAWHEWQRRSGIYLAACLIGLMGLSLLFLVIPATSALALASHLLFLMAIVLLVARAAPWRTEGTRTNREEWLALLVPALALIAGRLHQAIPVLYSALRWPGPLPFTSLLFNVGELLVVLAALPLWWAYGRKASWWAWSLAALPAFLFAALYWSNAAMTGILTIWSTGMTLFLPWPLYAASIWLATTTLLTPRARAHGTTWAILLLAAGGYAPQLSAHAFLGLIALTLLAGILQQQATAERLPLAQQPYHPAPQPVVTEVTGSAQN